VDKICSKSAKNTVSVEVLAVTNAMADIELETTSYTRIQDTSADIRLETNAAYSSVNSEMQQANDALLNESDNTAKKCSTMQLARLFGVLLAIILLTLLACLVSVFVEVARHESEIAALMSEIQSLKIVSEIPGEYSTFPAFSCASLTSSSLSGYYWVRNSIGSSVRVYCNMTLSCGGFTGGWMRVAELDMTNSSHQCLTDLNEENYNNIRTCMRSDSGNGCYSTNFSVEKSSYSKVVLG